MDYETIESLVIQAKKNNEAAKEKLAKQFMPMILNLSYKTFVTSYEPCDIQNECYKTLFKCVEYYNETSHRFVAYATNAIKNSINYLIRSSVKKSSIAETTLYPHHELDNILYDTEEVEEFIITKSTHDRITKALNSLNTQEKELLRFIFEDKNSLKSYAEIKQINYSTAISRKRIALRKLKSSLENII